MSEKNGSLILNTDQLGMHLAEPSMDELMHDYAQIRHVYAAGIREITSRLEVLQSEFQYRGRHFRHAEAALVQRRIHAQAALRGISASGRALV